MQTKTAQLLVCIVVEEEDAEDEPYATELQQRWVTAKINKRNALNLKKLPIFNPPTNSSTSLSPWNRYKTTEGVSIESTRTRNWYMGLIRVGSNRIVFFYPSMVFMIRQISTAKSQCPSPMVVDIDFGMSHT